MRIEEVILKIRNGEIKKEMFYFLIQINPEKMK